MSEPNLKSTFTAVRTTTSSLLTAHSKGTLNRLVFESEHSNGGGNSDRSLLFRLCQVVVIVMRSVTPLSYIYLIFLCSWLILFPEYDFNYQYFGGKIAFSLITIWMVLEALFFPYYYYIFKRCNLMNPNLEHFACDQATRVRLVTNCFQAMKAAASPGSAMVTDHDAYLRKVIEGWFLDVPISEIYHGNFAQWSSWAFFGKEWTHLSPLEVEHNNQLVAYVEKEANWSFPPGFAKDMPSARLTIDPVFATQRPFYFYATIYILNMSAHLALNLLGFTRKREYDTPAQSIYHRKATIKTKHSDDDEIAKPIVFIHGIGIGFAHYMGLIMAFPRDVDVYLVEWPHVAMQLTDKAPTIEESVSTMIRMLNDGHHPQACFVAHSLGTTALSWMLHDPIGCKMVASSVMLDPVTFLLCDPTVATSFVYKDPTTTIDFLMHFFLSRELFIANALSRHFQWSHNIMFVEDLIGDNDSVKTEKNVFYDTKILKDEVLTGNVRKSKRIKNVANDVHTQNRYGSIEQTEVVTRRSTRNLKSIQDDKNDGSDEGGSHKANSDSDKSEDSTSSQDLKHTIILSSHDAIVPVGPVSQYLETKLREGHNCFEVVIFHGTHGEMFLYPKWVEIISNKVKLRCGVI